MIQNLLYIINKYNLVYIEKLKYCYILSRRECFTYQGLRKINSFFSQINDFSYYTLSTTHFVSTKQAVIAGKCRHSMGIAGKCCHRMGIAGKCCHSMGIAGKQMSQWEQQVKCRHASQSYVLTNIIHPPFLRYGTFIIYIIIVQCVVQDGYHISIEYR